MQCGQVQGGASVGNRSRACASVAALTVDGVVLGGLNTGEEREERNGIIRSVVAALPPQLPRVLSAAAGPEDMLDAGDCLFTTNSKPQTRSIV